VLDLIRALEAIDQVDRGAVGGRPAGQQDAGGAQALQPLDVGAPVRLAFGAVVFHRRDNDLIDDHGPILLRCRPRDTVGWMPFPLDDFQVEAIRAIAGDQSVIVSAPAGAGKTLVAEFAIMAALEAGQRVAYTTPLKAPIVVMTTEILRNAL